MGQRMGRLLCLMLLVALQQHPGCTAVTPPAGAGGWGTVPVGAHRHRLLLDMVEPAVTVQSAPTPAPMPAGSGTIIDTLVDQKCSMMHHALITGQVLVQGPTNLQPTEVQCCASCLNTENCTAWVYCPVEGGCSAEQSNITLVSNTTAGAPDETEQRRQLQLVHLGCRLLSIPAFVLLKDSPQILAKGPDVQFVAGTPVSIHLPMFPGYSLKPGMDTVAGLGYRCSGTLLLYSCLLKGDAQELASMCSEDPLCKAFVYLPNGVDSLSEPIGIFKGGAEVHSIDASQLATNPATALYIKDSVLTTVGRPQGRSSSTTYNSVLWIVLPTVLATALLIVAVVAAYALLQMRKQVRQHAEEVAAAAAAAEAAAAASSQQRQKRSASGSRAKAAVPGGTSGTAGGAAGTAAAPIGGSAFVSVHLLPKPSPPQSGSSGVSGGSSPPHSGSATSTVTTAGVQCPQCGVALGIRCRSEWLPPQMRQMFTCAPAHPPQQQPPQPAAQQYPQQQQAVQQQPLQQQQPQAHHQQLQQQQLAMQPQLQPQPQQQPAVQPQLQPQQQPQQQPAAQPQPQQQR